MKLLVGIGNPGRRYSGNRHNVGYMALDQISADHGFGSWKNKFQGAVCTGRIGSEKVLLLKPETFVNKSGQAVGAASRYYQLDAESIVVFHDELDLVPGKVKTKLGGGHAGHNGLRSIVQHIGPDFWRVRIGIGHPGRKELVTGYVLKDFAAAERTGLKALLSGISDGAPELVAGERPGFHNAIARAMTDFAGAGDVRADDAPAKGDGRTAGLSKNKPSLLGKLAEIFR